MADPKHQWNRKHHFDPAHFAPKADRMEFNIDND
jgi:hypothetical protein